MRVDAVVVRERDEVRVSPSSSPTLRARERPRSERTAYDVERCGRERSSSTRSSSFWSTTDHAQSLDSPAPRPSRETSPARRFGPTVATTRSNDGSSRGTGRRLRHARADRAARHRAPRRPRRRAVRPNGACEHPRADGSRPRADRRGRRIAGRHAPRCSRRWTTRVCTCSATTSSSASLPRSIAGSTMARGAYVARLDADDVAMPATGSQRQLARALGSEGRGSRLGGDGARRQRARRRAAHDAGWRRCVRWAALFSSPFLHPTVLVERDVLDRHGLRYDERVRRERGLRALVASPRRRRRRQPARSARPLSRPSAPGIAAPPRRCSASASFAWRSGRSPTSRRSSRPASESSPGGSASPTRSRQVKPRQPLAALLELIRRFERARSEPVGAARAGPRSRARCQRSSRAPPRPVSRARPCGSIPRFPLTSRARRRDRRRARLGTSRGRGLVAPARGGQPTPRPSASTAVFPEPTPYRAPLLDRIAALPEVDLTVVYAAENRGPAAPGASQPSTARSSSAVCASPAPRAYSSDTTTRSRRVSCRALNGVRLRRRRRLRLEHVRGAGRDRVVPARGVPYVLVVESHDEGPRPGGGGR